MANIIPYRQALSNTCFVACFLMLIQEKYGINPDSNIEKQILVKGAERKYPFLVAGVPKEVFNHFKKRISIVVDNKYFTNILVKEFNDKANFNVCYHKITLDYIRELLKETPVICHIDDNLLGDYSHVSHFVVLEKVTDKRVFLIDPWDGKRKSISNERLEEAILSLKKHIKMCPLLFYLD